ncbi:serine/threonine-protein kinase [Sorangium cellulosum]|uniref:Protein kinase n=1 Tax=Sorangium cellulosum TaxID=56 RepID=A0A150QIK8_SORCE|nr:serine/threonine-protein kinase [Sorangium cellulosum]KYF67773.1 protein kinase [Sorangium cellulosum]
MPSSTDTTAAATQPVEGSLVGKRVQKYEIVRVIGRGGMGMVYEAVNTAIGKRVAMKFVDADLAQNKDSVARFHREAQAASAVESAHIVEIFDAGFADDIPFLVMELLRGEDLGHRIRRCGRLELGEALHVTAQILRGLHRAHEAGIVHRDLKPDNIFLVDRDDDPNFAKILDFGISKVRRVDGAPAHTLTREGTVLGTPFYMSPEQAQALPDVDGRTDLWAAGAILYECLTGHPPHSGNSYEQVIVNICMKDAQDVRMSNPAVPEPIARVIAKALTRDRDQRFSSARDFLDALIGAAGGLLGPRRSSSDELTVPAAIAPGVPGHTPAKQTPADPGIGLDPTLEVPGSGSKVGWVSNGRTGARGPRRLVLVAIALLSLIGGLAGAVLHARRSPAEATAAIAPAPPAQVSVELRTNAEGARFTVDGVALVDRTLRGRTGETKRVRVEASGYTPVDKEVTLQAGRTPIEVLLHPLPLAVTPVPPAIETAAEPAPTAPAPPPKAAPSAKKTATLPFAARPRGAGTGAKPAASSQATPAVATSKPAGVAAGLQLKVD